MFAKRDNWVRQTEPFWVPSDSKKVRRTVPIRARTVVRANQARYAGIDMAKVRLAVAGRQGIPSHVQDEA